MAMVGESLLKATRSSKNSRNSRTLARSFVQKSKRCAKIRNGRQCASSSNIPKELTLRKNAAYVLSDLIARAYEFANESEQQLPEYHYQGKRLLAVGKEHGGVALCSEDRASADRISPRYSLLNSPEPAQVTSCLPQLLRCSQRSRPHASTKPASWSSSARSSCSLSLPSSWLSTRPTTVLSMRQSPRAARVRTTGSL